jgi:galactose mutarotase-like enzyme
MRHGAGTASDFRRPYHVRAFSHSRPPLAFDAFSLKVRAFSLVARSLLALAPRTSTMPFRQLKVVGLPALSLFNDEIECIVVPSLGGKITNLRRRRGREWLWRHPDRDFADVPVDGSFPDTGGWDECFPTIAPSPMPGGRPGEPELPDHGELWALPWTNDVLETPVATVLTSRAEGHLLPYEFHRDIVVPNEGAEIRFEYRLVPRGLVPFPFIWAAHPIFSAPAGMTVTLPTVRQMRVDHAVARPDLVADAEVPWPLDGEAHSWKVPAIGGWSAKLFGDIGASGMVVLTDPTRGEQLEMAVDPGSLPNLGLWIDARGTLARIGVEPCLGAPDRLDRAVKEWGSAALLEPGVSRHWAVTVRLPTFD